MQTQSGVRCASVVLQTNQKKGAEEEEEEEKDEEKEDDEEEDEEHRRCLECRGPSPIESSRCCWRQCWLETLTDWTTCARKLTASSCWPPSSSNIQQLQLYLLRV